MRKIYLQPHDIFYAEQMSNLLSDPEVRGPLGLSENETSIAVMMDFIREMQLEEMMGNHYSRMIMNEDFELIGVITLHNIDQLHRCSHISTWIGSAHWGKGYNQLAKEKMLYHAFEHLHLQHIFAGARVENFRSRKAQRKLPYMTINTLNYPQELMRLENREQAFCILNVVERKDFLNWYYQKIAI